uniref:Uncharacterized protein n=1 Tax=Anguilla anguilla TaxID=7936 RepID=A0A0E9T134_ANGAN
MHVFSIELQSKTRGVGVLQAEHYLQSHFFHQVAVFDNRRCCSSLFGNGLSSRELEV